MCWAVCPCATCDRTNRTIGIKKIIFADKDLQFKDHQRYHHAQHDSCDFCIQTPRFNHMSRIFEKQDPHPMFILVHVTRKAFEESSKPVRVVNLQCKECDLSFRVKAEKMGHDRAIHYKEEFICDVCKKTFRGNKTLTATCNSFMTVLMVRR